MNTNKIEESFQKVIYDLTYREQIALVTKLMLHIDGNLEE